MNYFHGPMIDMFRGTYELLLASHPWSKWSTDRRCYDCLTMDIRTIESIHIMLNSWLDYTWLDIHGLCQSSMSHIILLFFFDTGTLIHVLLLLLLSSKSLAQSIIQHSHIQWMIGNLTLHSLTRPLAIQPIHICHTQCQQCLWWKRISFKTHRSLLFSVWDLPSIRHASACSGSIMRSVNSKQRMASEMFPSPKCCRPHSYKSSG